MISDAEIYGIARQLGFDDDAARVAVAIAITEGGRSGLVGDGGQSFGPYQFHAAGQLPAYAAAVGLPLYEAGRYAIDHQAHAVEWALSNYLGRVIIEGQGQGLAGAELATYAQRHGQRSVVPERSGQNYLAIANVDFGGPADRAGMLAALTTDSGPALGAGALLLTILVGAFIALKG